MFGTGSSSTDDGEAWVPPQPEQLAPGTRIGDYLVEHRLGAGGFGTVYLGVHHVIGKQAAIKVLHPHLSGSPEHARRFVNEARAVNQIGHPHIVDIFDFGRNDDGSLYYVMEYLDAPSLDAVLRERGSLTLAEARPVLVGLAAALDAAHERGVVHRDLKPANVLVPSAPDGALEPILLDFGIAKLTVTADDQEQTATGRMLGTPSYMSPEQIRGAAVDRRSDVYAFGVLAFRVLTGSPPFRGDSTFSTLSMHMQQQPPAPSSLAPQLPAAVDHAVMAMLAKAPQDRPSSLVTAVQALFAATAPPRASRSRGWWILAGLGATATAGIGLWASRPPPAQRTTLDPTPVERTAVAMGPVAAPVDVLEASEPPKPSATIQPPATIEIDGPPAGTTVRDADGRVLGTLPGPIALPHGTEPVVLTLEQRGYRSATTTVIPDADRSVQIQLHRASAPARRRKLNPDLESPF